MENNTSNVWSLTRTIALKQLCQDGVSLANCVKMIRSSIKFVEPGTMKISKLMTRSFVVITSVRKRMGYLPAVTWQTLHTPVIQRNNVPTLIWTKLIAKDRPLEPFLHRTSVMATVIWNIVKMNLFVMVIGMGISVKIIIILQTWLAWRYMKIMHLLAKWLVAMMRTSQQTTIYVIILITTWWDLMGIHI